MRPSEDRNLQSELRIGAITVAERMARAGLDFARREARTRCADYLRGVGIEPNDRLMQRIIDLVESEFDEEMADCVVDQPVRDNANHMRIAAIRAVDELTRNGWRRFQRKTIEETAIAALKAVLGKVAVTSTKRELLLSDTEEELSMRRPKEKKAPRRVVVFEDESDSPELIAAKIEPTKAPPSPPAPVKARPPVKHTILGKPIAPRRGRPQKNPHEANGQPKGSLELEIDDESPKKKIGDEEPSKKDSREGRERRTGQKRGSFFDEDRIGKLEEEDPDVPSFVPRDASDEEAFAFEREMDSDDEEDDDEAEQQDAEEPDVAALAETNGHADGVDWTFVPSSHAAKPVTTRVYERAPRDTGDTVARFLEGNLRAQDFTAKKIMMACFTVLQKQYEVKELHVIAQKLCTAYRCKWNESEWQLVVGAFQPVQPHNGAPRFSILDYAGRDCPERILKLLPGAETALCKRPSRERSDPRSIVLTAMRLLEGEKISDADKRYIARILAIPRGFDLSDEDVLTLMAPPTECKQESLPEREAVETPDKNDFGIAGLALEVTGRARCKPGTEEKVLILSGRYSVGLPLNNPRDLTDHGPREEELNGNHDCPKRPAGTSWEAWTEE
jgi:hypothetical protein